MAVTVDWNTLTFFVPQADLTLLSGTLYQMDTENYFRTELLRIMGSEEGMPFEDSFRHFTEVVISGVTYARLIEMINGYNVTFTPDAQWSVIFTGSNNNIWDIDGGVLNQNQVQVIPQNSAGLIRESGVPRKGEALAFSISMVQSSDKDTPFTGAVSGTISQDQGALVAITNAITSTGSGLHAVSLTAAEMDFDEVACVFTGSGASQRELIIRTSS